MKNTVINILSLILLITFGVGLVISLNNIQPSTCTIQSNFGSEPIDVDKVNELTCNYVASLGIVKAYPVASEIHRIEFKPNNTLEFICASDYTANIETNEVSNEMSRLFKLIVNYEIDTSVVNDILNHSNTTATMSYMSLYDVDKQSMLSYCGFDEGVAQIYYLDTTTLSDAVYSYIYDFSIYIYKDNWCYEYSFLFSSSSQLSPTAMTTALNTIFTTGAYEGNLIILSSNSIRQFSVVENTYILN